MDAALFFVIAALLLHVLYLPHFRTVFNNYPHGGQRFLHVVYLAENVGHKTTAIPLSMFKMLLGNAPEKVRGLSAIACHSWPKSLRNDCIPEHKTFSELLSMPLAPEEQVKFASNNNARHFAPLGYVPYVAGAFIGLMLHLPPILILHGALLSNALFIIALGYWTLRLVPFIAWPLAYIMLVPTSVFNRLLIMPDALTMDLSFMAIAVSLYLMVKPKRLSWLELLGLLVLALAIGLIKVAYFFIPLVYCIIPTRCFGSAVRKGVLIVASVIGAAYISGEWIAYCMEYYAYRAPANVSTYDNPDSYFGKASYILHEPIAYASNIGKTFLDKGLLMEKGRNLLAWQGRRNYAIDPVPFFLPLFMLALFGKYLSGTPPSFSTRERFFFLGVFAMSVYVLFTVMFFHLPSIGMSHVTRTTYEFVQRWVQGRYFAPLLPFLLLAIYGLVPYRETLAARAKPLLIAFTIGMLAWLHYKALVPLAGI